MRRSFVLLAVLASNPAYAKTIIECGGSSGWAYYFAPAGQAAEDEGWIEDGISKGAIALTELDGTFDLLIKDFIGMTSATSEGAKVSLVDSYGDFITVLVNYPAGSKELYTFDFGRRKVVWSQHKFGVAFDKIHSMIADCD